jgi:thiosulfate dehydrogenase [quinone] large subunit
MNKQLSMAVFLSRVGLGVLFFYAGITKVLNPSWSAAGYLNSAKTFPGLYHWFASAGNIGWVNLVNEWGLTLVGVALIIGLLVRWASIGGILLMVLYYLPTLQFPYVGANSYLVDEHIIFITVFFILIASNAGTYWGLGSMFHGRLK